METVLQLNMSMRTSEWSRSVHSAMGVGAEARVHAFRCSAGGTSLIAELRCHEGPNLEKSKHCIDAVMSGCQTVF